jgi:homoserine kinase
MSMNRIKAFAPATVANVSCGFDVLGFALDKVGDTLELELLPNSTIQIDPIKGPGNLSTEPDKNICGVIAKAMLQAMDSKQGLRMALTKGVLPGSGLGSSAASAAVTAFAVNELFNKSFSEKQLVEFAMLGEKLASGTAHADNVAPALLGGFTAIRSYEPLDIIKIPVPSELYCTVIHPKIEVRTELSRNILKKQVELKTAIKQWGNVAGLVAGLYSNNYELIGRSLTDYIIEPVRSRLIPGYYELTQYALLAGALGCGISGSGPSVFSLSKGLTTAQKVAQAFNEKATLLGLPFDIYISKIGDRGARIVEM